MKCRTLLPVCVSHTVHRMLRDAENTRPPSFDQASAVTGSVSPSKQCTTLPVATSTMFTASTHAVATKVPSGDNLTGPPVWNTSRDAASAYALRGCAWTCVIPARQPLPRCRRRRRKNRRSGKGK